MTTDRHELLDNWIAEWSTAHYQWVGDPDWSWIERIELARECVRLQAEIASLRQALTGRTVSCEACNHNAKEMDRLRAIVYPGKCDYTNLVLDAGTKCNEPARRIHDPGPGGWTAYRCDRHVTKTGYPL